jgi:hypothetical protein
MLSRDVKSHNKLKVSELVFFLECLRVRCEFIFEQVEDNRKYCDFQFWKYRQYCDDSYFTKSRTRDCRCFPSTP